VKAFAAAGFLAALLALGVALTAGAGSSAQAGPVGDLKPDLVTLGFGEDLVLQTGRERTRLRLGNTIANRGPGPLEIFPEQGTDNCDPASEGTDRFAYQRVFDDADPNDGIFRRAEDTGFQRREAGCMAFHPAHDHWHFDDFSHYKLKRQATDEAVANSTKVSFCVIDTSRPFSGLAGSPEGTFYPQNPAGSSGCDAAATEGISVGWADTYSSYLPGQALDVTRIPKGRYCLISKADPSNLLLEADEANNDRRRLLSLNVATGRLARLPGGC
jgi:hypothetical protein